MAANGPSAHLAVAVSIGSTLSQQRHLSSVLPFALGIETGSLGPSRFSRFGSNVGTCPSFLFRERAQIVGVFLTVDAVLERSSGRWGSATNRSKVDMHADHEVRYWTHALGVTKERLQEAVDKVGNSAPAVGKELAA